MESTGHTYIAIDLKSFYASVECIERGLEPLTTNLVVADASRTEKTICLAVSPALKTFGVSSRPRLFEVVQTIKKVNDQRLKTSGRNHFIGSSYDATILDHSDEYAVDYIVATPQMSKYMTMSNAIYGIYLKYIAPEDIHVYSIDEVFIDVTPYLNTYKCSAYDLVQTMISDVYATTGITATAGIGSNLYLAKVAMDIVAKHAQADERGVRIAQLDEITYRQLLWDHQPLTDFWRIGKGITRRLASVGLTTMGDIAKASVASINEPVNEDTLYELLGINAELLIDHAWGKEPVTIKDIKAYTPSATSLSSGQVLWCGYDHTKARLVLKEMAEQLALDMLDKGVTSEQLVLTIGYDIENITDPTIGYQGETTKDPYGRLIPKHAHGTIHLDGYTNSVNQIREGFENLFDRIVDPKLLVRRFTLNACNLKSELTKSTVVQPSLFDNSELYFQKALEQKKDAAMAKAMLDIKARFGKNAILKGMNLEEGGTMKERNMQVGGHKA